MRCFQVTIATILVQLVKAASGADPSYQVLPALREQAKIVNGWVSQRKESIPELLRKHQVDAWLISQHEYAEETVFWTLKSAEAFSARRRTTYLYLADPAAGEPTEYSWVDNTDRLWEGLSAVLQRNQPGSIAINAHPEIAFSSGMHAGELAAMASALDSRWIDRFVVKPMLGVEFIGTQMDARLGWYRKLQETAWATIQEAFSEKVIVPDATTTQDVQWWMREKLQAMNYTTWFQPSVSILNRVGENGPGDPAGDDTITYGDLLHVDFGVSAMGMNTDTQHLGYVLRPGQTEDDVPGDIYQGLRKGNRLQDIVRENMVPGMTGNAILEAARKQMHDEGIEGKIYSHPVGDWGHSAGTLLGFSNIQKNVSVLGELPLLNQTWYSIELSVEHYVEEFDKTLLFPLEEDVYWNGKDAEFQWVYGRQEKLHLIHAPNTVSAPIDEYL